MNEALYNKANKILINEGKWTALDIRFLEIKRKGGIKLSIKKLWKKQVKQLKYLLKLKGFNHIN